MRPRRKGPPSTVAESYFSPDSADAKGGTPSKLGGNKFSTRGGYRGPPLRAAYLTLDVHTPSFQVFRLFPVSPSFAPGPGDMICGGRKARDSLILLYASAGRPARFRASFHLPCPPRCIRALPGIF